MNTMTPDQPMDACELLDADHIAVKHLFVEYARQATILGADPGGERRELALKICDELTVHATIEEEIFYPALGAAVPAAQAKLQEAQAEHDEAKQLIAEIQALGEASPAMDALVAKLAGAIEHHVKEERDELFPKAKAAPGLDLMEVGEHLRARQNEIVKQTA